MFGKGVVIHVLMRCLCRERVGSAHERSREGVSDWESEHHALSETRGCQATVDPPLPDRHVARSILELFTVELKPRCQLKSSAYSKLYCQHPFTLVDLQGARSVASRVFCHWQCTRAILIDLVHISCTLLFSLFLQSQLNMISVKRRETFTNPNLSPSRLDLT
jgi:hypothetical protein